jgi:hypothetical protein
VLRQIIEHCGGWRKAITLQSGVVDVETDTTIWPQQERVEMLEVIRAHLVNKVRQLTEQVIKFSLSEPSMDTGRALTTSRRVRRRDRASSPIHSADSDAAVAVEQSRQNSTQADSVHRSEAVVQTEASWALHSASIVDSSTQTTTAHQPIAKVPSNLGHNAEELQSSPQSPQSPQCPQPLLSPLRTHQSGQDAVTQTTAIQTADAGVATDAALTQIPAALPLPQRHISTTHDAGCQSEADESISPQTQDAQFDTSDLCAAGESEDAANQTDNDSDKEVS